MKLRLTLGALLLAVAGWPGPAGGAPMFYTNETAFQQALGALDFSWIRESFEGPEWATSRFPGTTNDIVSQGLLWYAEERMATRSGLWGRTGSYGVYNSSAEGDGNEAPNDHLYAHSLELAAIGGWFTGRGTLRVYNRASVLVGTLTLNSAFQFAGIVDPEGLISVEFGGGQFGADDFTIALVRPPAAPPRLSLEELSATRGAVLRIQGQWGRTNVLEASVDLQAWVPISTNVMPSSVCPTCPAVYVEDPAGRQAPRRFYRAYQVP